MYSADGQVCVLPGQTCLIIDKQYHVLLPSHAWFSHMNPRPNSCNYFLIYVTQFFFFIQVELTEYAL